MLSLSNNLSLSNLNTWHPTSETSLQLFLEHKRLGHASDIASVEQWLDTSRNLAHFTQDTASEQPSYTVADGAVVFDGNDHISASSEIDLDGGFIVAIRLSIDSSISNDIMIASDTSANNFIRFDSASSVRFKIDGSASSFITLSSNLVAGQKHTVMLARDSDDVNTFYLDGVAQTDTEVLSGNLFLDTLGQRAGNHNHFAGKIYEVQIYSSYSLDLIKRVNTHLNMI